MKMNFEKYSLEELESALATIDKEKYPDNYEKLLLALQKKKAEAPAPKSNGTIITYWINKDKKDPLGVNKFRHGISLLWFFLLTLLAMVGLSNGKLWVPGKRDVLIIEGAMARWISLAILLYASWLGYRAIFPKKNESLPDLQKNNKN